MKTLLTLIFMISVMPATMAQSKGKYAKVNGMDMYYEIHGKGAPLVLVHGGGSDIYVTFGSVLNDLAKYHQVIGVDLQAHGRTPDRGQPTSFEQDADDVAALLKQLNIPKADIFGFSNGGVTALQLAIRHPEVVNKIIVASAFYKAAGAYPWLWEFMKNASFEQMPRQLKDAYLKINPNPEALRIMHDRDLARMQSFEDIPEEKIKKIKAPALILIGDTDVVRPEHAVEMYRLLQNARLMILPGGHGEYIGELTTLKPGKNQEYPVVQLINEFLAVTP